MNDKGEYNRCLVPDLPLDDRAWTVGGRVEFKPREYVPLGEGVKKPEKKNKTRPRQLTITITKKKTNKRKKDDNPRRIMDVKKVRLDSIYKKTTEEN